MTPKTTSDGMFRAVVRPHKERLTDRWTVRYAILHVPTGRMVMWNLTEARADQRIVDLERPEDRKAALALIGGRHRAAGAVSGR